LDRSDPRTLIDVDTAASVASTLGANVPTVFHFVAVANRLASLPEQQIATKPENVCLVCDLVNDYEDASLSVVALRLPADQKALWQEIGDHFEAMTPVELECGNDDAVQLPGWARIRGIADELLTRFVLTTTKGKAEWTSSQPDIIAECRRVLSAKCVPPK
jgi:hypothetical protein